MIKSNDNTLCTPLRIHPLLLYNQSPWGLGCASHSNPALRAGAEGIPMGKNTVLVRGYIRSPHSGLFVARSRATLSTQNIYTGFKLTIEKLINYPGLDHEVST